MCRRDGLGSLTMPPVQNEVPFSRRKHRQIAWLGRASKSAAADPESKRSHHIRRCDGPFALAYVHVPDMSALQNPTGTAGHQRGETLPPQREECPRRKRFRDRAAEPRPGDRILFARPRTNNACAHCIVQAPSEFLTFWRF